MAMRYDPPDPPGDDQQLPPISWWERESRDQPGRRMYARLVVRPGNTAHIEFYGDRRSGGPGLVQRYRSRATALRLLERRGWTLATVAIP